MLIKRNAHITKINCCLFWMNWSHNISEGLQHSSQIGSPLPSSSSSCSSSSSSTQTPTTAKNQMKPGGHTRCPLRLIYCCSKETLTADPRVSRVLQPAGSQLNFSSTHIDAFLGDLLTVNPKLVPDLLYVSAEERTHKPQLPDAFAPPPPSCIGEAQ